MAKPDDKGNHKIQVTFVVQGAPVPGEYNENQPLKAAVKKVLEETGNEGQDISKWQLRMNGRLLDLEKKFKEEGIVSGAKLILSVQTGRGG